MFGLDPFSRPVAIIEIVLLLTLAAFIGWLIAQLILSSRIHALRAAIADKEANLADCRRAKAKAPANAAVSAPEPIVINPASVTEGATLSQPSATAILPPESKTTSVVQPITSAATVIPAGSSEAAVLSRIALRASELNFDRIGRATADDADDLKGIVGIGPFLERKLHSLGIFTFRQIANFTKEDITQVNEIIEFFPGRIQRDNWVGQAKSFYERKYGKE